MGKEKLFGIGGAVLFHVLIVLFLFFYYLKPVNIARTAGDWEGVPVMFGDVPDALGTHDPGGRSSTSSAGSSVTVNAEKTNISKPVDATPKAVTPSNTKNPEITPVTQNEEQTIAVNATPKKVHAEENHKATSVAKHPTKEELDQQRQLAEKDQIRNQMAAAFGNGNDRTGSRGTTSGEGTQGATTGNANYGKTSGVGGWGSFDLGGRSLGRGGLVRPSYTVDDYGIVVIDIVVDPKGNVVEASIGKGTNTASPILKREALKAARQTKFNEVSSFINQKGTITYNFNLN